MFSDMKTAGRSYDRPVFFLGVVLLLPLLQFFALSSCALESERIAPYQGRVTLAVDSGGADTVGVDISEHGGMILYTAESDAEDEFSDTAYFEGDSEGYFDGVLFFTASATIRAPWLQKPLRILIPQYNIDTFVTVQAYLKSHELEIDGSDLGLIYAAPDHPTSDSSEIRESK